MTVAPNDFAAEQAVLGTLLYGKLTPDEIPELKAEHFFHGSHRYVFEAISQLHGQAQSVDTVVVNSELAARGRDKQVASPGYLVELLNSVPAMGEKQLQAFARTVKNRHTTRELLGLARKVIGTIENGVGDPAALLSETEGVVHELAMGTREDSVVTMKEATSRAVRRMQEHAQVARTGGGPTGLSTGLDKLDRFLGGLHAGELTVLAARPGMGKSALAMALAVQVARQKRGAAVFSLEMAAEQLALRAVCSHARLPVGSARFASFGDEGWRRFTASALDVAKLPIFIDESGVTTLAQLRARARKIQRQCEASKTPLGIVAVDYLQLVNNPKESREQAIAEVSRALKALAKELHVSVLALSQLNRGVESRSDKRPMLGDLRESGAIEQDADNVIALYRDDYYHEHSAEPGVCEALILKQRSGPVGTVKLAFHAETVSFFNHEHGL